MSVFSIFKSNGKNEKKKEKGETLTINKEGMKRKRK